MTQSDLGFYRTLFEELDTGLLRSKFLGLLLDSQHVERGSIWVEEEPGYRCLEAAGPGADAVRGLLLPKGRPSLVDWVIRHGRMTIGQPGADRRHFAEIEAGLDVKSSAILCYPLILSNGRVYGAVQLIDTSAAGDRLNLDPNYLQHLEGLISIGAIALSRTLDFRRLDDENEQLKRNLKALTDDSLIVGRSRAFNQALDLAASYARTDFPVLISGESGVGKEVFARRIHRLGDRAGGPFLAQNCGAIPGELLESELFGHRKGAFTGADRDRVGLFEAAKGGTVFLDEVSELPAPLQVKLLRTIQEKEVKPLGGNESRRVDFRLVAAANRDLNRMKDRGEFREDLFYRLSVLPLKLPPLRDRDGDVGLLIDYFLDREAARLNRPRLKLLPEARTRLTDYTWPGNVREVENVVRYLIAVNPTGPVGPESIPEQLLQDRDSEAPPLARDKTPPSPARPADLAQSPDPAVDFAAENLPWEEMERRYALALLEKTRWNVAAAARLARLNRSTFNARLRRLGINRYGND